MVWCGGKSFGRGRQPAPVRRMERLPVITSRMSTSRRRPPGLAGGISGSRMVHCASVKSLGYGLRGMASTPCAILGLAAPPYESIATFSDTLSGSDLRHHVLVGVHVSACLHSGRCCLVFPFRDHRGTSCVSLHRRAIVTVAIMALSGIPKPVIAIRLVLGKLVAAR